MYYADAEWKGLNMLTRTLRYAIQIPLLRTAVAVLIATTVSLQVHAQTRDILVSADASLRNALAEANGLFLFENAMNVVVSYDASSELARQIENAKPADVFISADLDSMDHVAELKLIEPDTRANLLGNTLVLVARADSQVALTIGQNFPLAQALGNGRLAMADPASVSSGKYGKAALETLGVWATVANKIAPAQSAQEALLLVSRGEASFAIAYQTDAAADKNVKIIAAFPESTHPPIIYPIAILTSSTNVLASIYVQWLRSGKADPFFEKQGFVVLH